MPVNDTTANRGYQLPHATNNLDYDIARLRASFNAIDADVGSLLTSVAGKAAVSHTHVISDVSGLQSALDAKMAANASLSLDFLSDVNTAGAVTNQFLRLFNGQWVPVSLDGSMIETGIVPVARLPAHLATTALNSAYAALVHSHAIADVTGLQTALDGKTAVGHSHAISDVTGLQSGIDAKANLAGGNQFSGNQGIGAAPSYRLDVSSGDTTANVGYAARLRSNATAAAATLQFTNNGGSVQNARITATDSKFLLIEGDTVDLITLNAIRQRIDATGKILQGTTTAFDAAVAATLNVYGGSSALAVKSAGTNNTAVSFYNDSTSARVGWIGTNGAVTSYNTSSDYRLKENVLPMHGALAKVLQLKPCSYTWKQDGSAGEGFLAHELQSVLPSAVIGEKDAVGGDGTPSYQGVDLSKLVPMLVAALQEANQKIDALQSEFDTYVAAHE